MTNKEKYKQAFSALQPSNEIRLEEKIMKEYKRKQSKRIIAMAAILCLAVFAGGGGAYAANVGGIQRTIQLWIHGDQTTAELNVNDDGTYTVKIPDANGGTKTQSGGGVAFDAFGNERPLTEEEILAEIGSPNVEYYDDGSIWFFYEDTAKDITGDFNDDNVCYINFDENFLRGSGSLAVADYIPIYSIVNSLAEAAGINRVQIAVNGSVNVKFRDSISLESPFERNLDYIGGE